MALTQKTMNELKSKKLKEVLEQLNQQEQEQHEKLMKSPTIMHVIKHIDLGMRQIEKNRNELITLKRQIESAVEDLRVGFKGAGLTLAVNGIPSFTSYGFWDEKKQSIDKVTFKLTKSTVTNNYGDKFTSWIKAQSELAEAAAEKVEDAFLKLKVAVETNNKDELNKAIKEFMDLEIS